MKRSTAVLIFFCIVLFLSSQAFAQPVKLGIPLPLTGTNAKFGEIEMRSYQIAMEEINAAGGVKGKKIALEFEDSQGKPEVARSIVERLIDVKKQPVIFGEYSSSCSKAVAAVANERKVPYLVVTGATDDITQQKYKYVFRLNPTNAYYAVGLMSFMNQVVKPKTIAILYESSDFGSSGAEDMVKQAAKNGIKVLVKEQYEKGAVDFRPILSKVKVAAAGRHLHGLLRHGRRPPDEADQGTPDRLQAVRGRRSRLRHPGIHPERQGSLRTRHDGDPLEPPDRLSRRTGSLQKNTRNSTKIIPPITAPKPIRPSTSSRTP